MQRKGIILAAGSGTRLRPTTLAVNKHLLPVFDKPMILYPLSSVMLAGVRDILIITNPGDEIAFHQLLGDGERFGINITYGVQETPSGLPDAYILGEKYLDGAPSVMALGDNFLYGQGLSAELESGVTSDTTSIYLYYVNNPRPYGVAVLDDDGGLIDIVEKPTRLIGNYAITGLYMFDGRASEIARGLTPSMRGELEIVDMMKRYLEEDNLRTHFLGRAITWLDMGTAERMMTVANFVQIADANRNLKICVPEEIAWRNGWIDDRGLDRATAMFAGTAYGDYIKQLPKMQTLY